MQLRSTPAEAAPVLNKPVLNTPVLKPTTASRGSNFAVLTIFALDLTAQITLWVPSFSPAQAGLPVTGAPPNDCSVDSFVGARGLKANPYSVSPGPLIAQIIWPEASLGIAQPGSPVNVVPT